MEMGRVMDMEMGDGGWMENDMRRVRSGNGDGDWDGNGDVGEE
jgi:hypothetical protein